MSQHYPAPIWPGSSGPALAYNTQQPMRPRALTFLEFVVKVRPHPSRRHPFVGMLAASAALLLVAACSSGSTAGDDAGDPSTTADAEGGAGEGYPVSVDNCGTEITVDAPPQQIVTIKSSTFELVLALGLGDRIVGQAFLDGPVPQDLQEAAADVPELAEREPSTEAVLAADPDFVFAGWESTFTDEGIGSRDSLGDLEIATYVAPAACQGEGYMPNPLTFDLIAEQITEAGQLLGAPDAAQELVDTQADELGNIEVSDAGLSALWYSSGSETPFIGAGIGAPQLLMDSVGLQNIAAAEEMSWISMSWEAIADAEPDVIVLVDSDWNTAENKIEVLESVPSMAALPAVQDGRYLIIDFPATEAGIRSASAAVELGEQLAQLEQTLP